MSDTVNKRNQVGTFLIGVLLLVFGILLLLSRAGVFSFNFTRVVAFVAIVVGGFEAIRAFAFSVPRRLFWGSALFLTGMLVLLISYAYVPDSWDQIWPSALIIPGLAFLMLYFASPREYLLIIVAALFVAVGWVGLLAVRRDFNFGSSIFGSLRFIIPVAVVLAGLYVIWKNFFRVRS